MSWKVIAKRINAEVCYTTHQTLSLTSQTTQYESRSLEEFKQNKTFIVQKLVRSRTTIPRWRYHGGPLRNSRRSLEEGGHCRRRRYQLGMGMKDDLKKLDRTMSTIKAVLLDAEKKQQDNEQLRVWLRRLKDVFLDAQDVLDEFDCELLRRDVAKMHGSIGRKVRHFFSRSNPLAFRFSIAHQIKVIREELDEVAKDRSNFHLEEHHVERHVLEGRREVTDSFVRPSEVIGRESVKEEIINTLMEKENDVDPLSVIPIVGIGGLGKTTLAKLVYNDDRVTREFDLKMWVCVPLDFNVAELRKEILKSAITATIGATNENLSIYQVVKRTTDISNLSMDQLQMFLRSTLKDKRFLLVLDDVWNEDRGKWNEVRDLLSTACGKGSKIIVTTRNSLIASVMGTKPPHNLECLSEDGSRSLFFKYAFGDEQLVEQFPKLKGIGWQIVQKCKGIPLALKSLGSLLCSKTDERDWIFIRDNEIWELKEQQNNPILSALRLSYSTMPSYLKQCFAYCSLIPKNVREANLKMIRIWMALDIIQSPNDKIDLEDIGKMHFNELCNRSFFHYLQNAEETFNFGQKFEMHDLIHDLAASIIQFEHSTINSHTKTAPDERVRHLRIFMKDGHARSILTILEKLKKVRSIFLEHEADEEPNIEEFFLSTCISRFRYLRLFDLSGFSFEVLPTSIGTLKHLRYLNLNENKKIKKLPDSICKLQSLQTLHLSGCSELEKLPRDIGNLLSLRTLSITTKQTDFPENGVGRLRSLQVLYIHNCKNLRSLPHDMRFCTILRTLIITECEQLDLAGGPNQVKQLSLQTLMIDELPQTTALPHWLEGAAHTLQLLLIGGCPELLALPEWLPNLTSLQTLLIGDCPKLSSLPAGMQRLTSLTHLEIKECKRLEERCKSEVGEDWPKIAHVPNLKIGLESNDDD